MTDKPADEMPKESWGKSQLFMEIRKRKLGVAFSNDIHVETQYIIYESELSALVGSLDRASDTRDEALAYMDQHQVAMQQATQVPGQMRCAKCKFVLTRNNLYLQSGTIGPGDNKTEPCPNGCGPLWPCTWKDDALEMAARLEERIIDWRRATDILTTIRQYAAEGWNNKIVELIDGIGK